MEKLRLGKTDLPVTRIGFGSIPIQRVSETEAIEVINRCIGHGINYFDTARAYTTSEGRIGKALAGKRDKYIIATKSTAKTSEEIEKHLHISLEELATDYIDLYQFHGVNDFDHLKKVLGPKGLMTVAKDALKKGLIRHIGITSHNMDVAKEAVKSDRFETMMFSFNCVTCEAETELFSLCRDHDVGFIAMKPLAGGMLEHIEIAIKYLLRFPDIAVIPGIQRPQEIDQIMSIYKGSHEMTRSEIQEMERLRKELGTKFCRRCDYCQPCPQEIPISLVTWGDSFIKRSSKDMIFSGWIGKGIEKAEDCSKCGQCEERCPFHLPVREMIEMSLNNYLEAKKQYEAELAAKKRN